MVKKKTKERNEDNNLYICMHNSAEKRKAILMGIKNSLILQEEYEKSKDIRTQKGLILLEIKKSMETIKSDYEKLKQHLPKVKDGISFVEKELRELDDEINVLRHETAHEIKEKTERKKKLQESKTSAGKVAKSKKTVTKSNLKSKTKVKSKPKKKVEQKKLTKLDRIKNNLQVIESKLKGI